MPEWKRIRGVNFLTSYARDAAEIWSRYDRETIDRELWFIESLGFNSVRLWLHSRPSFTQQEQTLSRLDDCLALCKNHNLTVLPVLFDSCGVERVGEVKVLTMEEVYRIFLGDNRFNAEYKEMMLRIMIKQRKDWYLRSGAAVQVPYSGSPSVLFWQWWQPNPGLSKLGKENWPGLERYVKDVVAVLEEHECVVGLDVMNEPYAIDFFRSTTPGSHIPTDKDKRLILPFVKHFTQYVKEISSEMLVTVGAAGLEEARMFEEFEDLISFHSYDVGQALKSKIEDAKKFAEEKGKPLLLTECLSGVLEQNKCATTDMEQLKSYQDNLPLVLVSNIGWYTWGPINGFPGFPWADIITNAGFRKPAAIFIAETLKKGFIRTLEMNNNE